MGGVSVLLGVFGRWSKQHLFIHTCCSKGAVSFARSSTSVASLNRYLSLSLFNRYLSLSLFNRYLSPSTLCCCCWHHFNIHVPLPNLPHTHTRVTVAIPPPTAPSQEHVAFVRNVAAGVAQEQLQALFEACGGIKGIRLPLDWNTGKPRVRKNSRKTVTCGGDEYHCVQ